MRPYIRGCTLPTPILEDALSTIAAGVRARDEIDGGATSAYNKMHVHERLSLAAFAAARGISLTPADRDALLTLTSGYIALAFEGYEPTHTVRGS